MEETLSGSKWHIAELGWNPSRQNIEETLLSLGNGYIGSRGVLEEIPEGSRAGTFFAGLYDNTGAQVRELINAPNPMSVQLAIGGEKLGAMAMDILDHKRILDMKQGLLFRHTLYQTARTKSRIDYQSLRFFSMHNKHVAAIQIEVTPLDKAETFTIRSSVDTSVTNSGLLTEGSKRHFHLTEFTQKDSANYLCVKTLENEILIGYASELVVMIDGKKQKPKRRKFEIKAKKGQKITIIKYFSMLTSKEAAASRVKSQSLATLKRVVHSGFERALGRHKKAWEKLWKKADIVIEGDPEVLRALRYNIYNLLTVGSPHTSDDVSFGARCLSGEGYRGHVFWDTEIFILPFFTMTFPEVAKRFLLYRYKRLDAARKNAKKNGYQGAMFPWESADTGMDVTPTWHKNFDGSIIEIFTMQREHHITADVAFAVFQYYNKTCDLDFLIKYGLEILLETARFWASRVKFDKKRKKFVIEEVIGPDEFHEDVDNNAYTNYLAAWNLKTAATLYLELKKKFPKKIEKLSVKKSELNDWENISEKLYIPYKSDGKLIEQFEGYFKKRKHPLPNIDESGLPPFPKNFQLSKIGNTQFVKQADVILLLYLFPDAFTENFKQRNFTYYESRTLHKSSLSASIHACVAARLGDLKMAYRYFRISAFSDLENIYGNVEEGIHAAALGGTWQAVIFGFLGLHLKDDLLAFHPHLPNKWKKVSFTLDYQGGVLNFTFTHLELKVTWKGAKKSKKPCTIVLYDESFSLSPGKEYRFPLVKELEPKMSMKGLY